MVDIDIRTIDGSGNQPEDHGAAGEELIHIFPRAFEDGYSEPRGGGINLPSTLPNVRDVSNIIAPQGDITGNPLNASDWLWQWGQFLDHDLSISEGSNIEELPEEEFGIELNPDDILYADFFTEIPLQRIPAEEGTGTEAGNPREVANEITAYIDGSNGYGSDITRAAAKRTDLGNSFFGTEGVPLPPEGQSPYDGKLLVANNGYGTNGVAFEGGADPNNTSGEILAPYNRNGSPNADPGDRVPDDQEFISGDIRINEQVGLISIHILLIREHNLVADKVAFHLDAGDDEGLNQAYARYRDEYVPSLGLETQPTEQQIRGEFIYEAARAVIGAKSQVITYQEFLPLLIGNEGTEDLEVIDPEILAPSIAVEFSGAAYRLGHTLLSDQIRTIDNNDVGSISLRDAFFRPDQISQNGVDDILIGLNYQQSNDADHRVIDGVRNNLFGAPGNGGQDLVAINLQRGRELGLPGYVAVYNALNPDNPIENFAALNPIFGADVAALFEQAYASVDQIDLWLGGLAEIPVEEGVLLGPTFSRIIEDQFARLRNYDRFFYADQLDNANSFLSVVSNAIDLDLKNTGLDDIIRSHVSHPELVPNDAFTVPFTNELRGTLESDGNIVGTEQADLIEGLTGNDVINGGEGDDIIFGGKGNDIIRGDAGADSLVGGEGNDFLIAQGNGDVLSGGVGNDTYRIFLDSTGGTQIVDEGGSDTLEIFDTEGGGAVNLILSDPRPGQTGIRKAGNDLLIDLNQDGIINPETDLTITDYFNDEKEAGLGAIEQVGNLTGQEIVDYAQSSPISNGSTVYRFFNPSVGVHFYTASAGERDSVRENLSNYEYEGESYVGAPHDEDLFTGAKPVYRFFNTNTGVHLYTIAEAERDAIIENLPNYTFEGVAYYGYETEQEGNQALYRFYNPVIDAHFYTPSAAERDAVLENLPDYQLESNGGVAFYIQPVANV
ncbi:MAG: peroxidase family protein [Pleurocapsa sp. MO_192.B19]|nr:peroxidase family protein [Pleurocapsa sp. MO_192.B19]